MDPIQFVHQQLETNKEFPTFQPGDTIVVSYRIVEGDKERIQSFKGDVIQVNGSGSTKTFTIRKISNGVGVERIFPINTPSLVSIEVLKRGRVRRAKLFYLRKLSGKKSRIKERKFVKK